MRLPPESSQPSEGQRQALRELRALARRSGGALTVEREHQWLSTVLLARVYLASGSLITPGQKTSLVDWEPIELQVPEDFPLSSPVASTARDDFPSLPHQALGSRFCVRVEKGNWDPSVGMGGFMQAVIETYQRIAVGALEGSLQAWRPMVYYPGRGCAVIKADLPSGERDNQNSPFGWAVAVEVNEDRLDIVEWLKSGDGASSDTGIVPRAELARVRATEPAAFLVPTVTVDQAVALEYSRWWDYLLSKLEAAGVAHAGEFLVRSLAGALPSTEHGADEPRRAALVCRVAPDTVRDSDEQEARFAVARLGPPDIELVAAMAAAQTAPAERIAQTGFLTSAVPWIRVYDGRPAVLTRRATGRPAERLAGRKILLLGCGGLGAPIAEHCVRAAAAHLQLVDDGEVNPGILSRQPYTDADIGQHKAAVLARRLGQIWPETTVTALVANILDSDLLSLPELSGYDLVIDATASRSVATKIEQARRGSDHGWPALVTFAINQEATHGVATVTPRGAVGAGVDLLRRFALRTCMDRDFADVYAAFFPAPAQRLNFRPDATCSDVTFVGSSTDVAALAAQLLDSALSSLDPSAAPRRPNRRLNIVRLGTDGGPRPGRVTLSCPADRVVAADNDPAYEIRIEERAVQAIRGHPVSGDRHVDGLLLGQVDEGCRVVWISHVWPLGEGSDGQWFGNFTAPDVQDSIGRHAKQSGGALSFIGFWRIQPGRLPAYKDADRAGLRTFASSPGFSSTKALLLTLELPAHAAAVESLSLWGTDMRAEIFAV